MATQSLSKACRNCKKAKRRCIPQLPFCQRCYEKNLPCSYLLEPVNDLDRRERDEKKPTPTMVRSWRTYTEPMPDMYTSIYGASDPHDGLTFNSMALVQDTVHCAMRRAVGGVMLPVLINNGCIRLLVMRFTEDTKLLRERKTCSFIHSEVIKLHHKIWRRTLTVDSLGRDLTISSDEIALVHLVTETANAISATVSTFANDHEQCGSAEESNQSLVDLLSTVRQLHQRTSAVMSDTTSSWLGWLVAESARRTLLSAYIVYELCHTILYGYCTYQPFLETLPFDPRSGLWEAGSNKEWELLLARSSRPVTAMTTIPLQSWTEFAEKTSEGGVLKSEYDGKFQRILLVCFHGLKAFESRQES